MPHNEKEAATGTSLTRQKAEAAAKSEALVKAAELIGANPHIQEHKPAMEGEIVKLRKLTTTRAAWPSSSTTSSPGLARAEAP